MCWRLFSELLSWNLHPGLVCGPLAWTGFQRTYMCKRSPLPPKMAPFLISAFCNCHFSKGLTSILPSYGSPYTQLLDQLGASWGQVCSILGSWSPIGTRGWPGSICWIEQNYQGLPNSSGELEQVMSLSPRLRWDLLGLSPSSPSTWPGQVISPFWTSVSSATKKGDTPTELL